MVLKESEARDCDRRPTEKDFGATAEYYLGRTPYLSAFFPEVVTTFGLTMQSTLLDLACGTGELSVGFAPYCGSVLAIDKSSKMLSMRSTIPENVRCFVGDLNIDASTLPAQADLVVIGRAIPYLEKAALLTFLKSVTTRSASVLICGATIDSSTPWYARYKNLRKRYSTQRVAADMYGMASFSGTEWAAARRIMVFGNMQYSTNGLLQHALSYSSSLSGILKDRSRFERELEELLEPYRKASNYVEAEVCSWGFEYSRT